MLNKVMGERFQCGLDLGSSMIKVGCLKTKDSKNFDLVGVYESSTHGLSHASVSDLGELSECIHSCILGLTKKTGIKVKEIQLGIGGGGVDSCSGDKHAYSSH